MWRGMDNEGSLLVGRTTGDSVLLSRRVQQLSEAGLQAEYLSGHDLLKVEPALMVGEHSSAAFLPDDCQLDAHRTVAFIERANRHFSSKGRYAEFYHEPVIRLLRSASCGEFEAVQTSKTTLYSKKAIIVAAGCWSGSLMDELLRESEILLHVPVRPRKGHLLMLENSDVLQLNHGLMEPSMSYHPYDIFSGSSRQFAGFSSEVDERIITGIWKRAVEFFPKLKELPLSEFSKGRKVRVGLRPYIPDGKPMIGPVPGLTNVFLATGHEGGGLAMGLGTAEMVADLVLGNPVRVNNTPFAVQGRCGS
ncbi:D-amino acid dehydrogenase small subunit [Morella rubra]|uniref:FAD-dependent oxidoreductase domain-containing protein 1 n=1 Tax=Morella rubra TaxID=262757 RepID=A0A6A1WNH2_9ROSI|nr:D-amino acid dehydrogenase small subunit [Morella rubra]